MEEEKQKEEKISGNSRLTLKVEVDPGCDIGNACQEACDLATKIGIDVTFNFNQVICTAFPHSKAIYLVGQYYNALASDRQYKFAWSREMRG